MLWGADPRRGRVVIARCPLAAAVGVRTNMPLSQADSLLRGIEAAEICLEPHDSQADKEAMYDLAERCAEQFSPLIALEPLDDFLWAGQVLHQPQALLMDVTGVSALFGGEDCLLREVTEFVSSRGYQPRLAIADTAAAAWAVAHYTPPQMRSPFQLEDMPTWLVPAGEQVAALANLPIAALRVRSETTKLLRRLGIHHIEALRRLPRSGLASRLGITLLQRLDQALGEIDEPLPMHHAAASNRLTTELEYPTADQDILGHHLEQLIEQIAGSLAKRQYGALRISCRLELQAAPAVEFRLGLFTPTADAEHLMRLFRGHLTQQRLPAMAHRLTVTVTMSGPLGVRQPTLDGIEAGPVGSLVELAQLIDALSGRLGRERVLGIEATHNPLPEAAIRLRPLTGQPPGTTVPGRPQPQRRPQRRIHGKAKKRDNTNRRRQDIQPAEHSIEHATQTDATTASPGDPLRRPLNLLPHPQRIHPLDSGNLNGEIASQPDQQPAPYQQQPPDKFRLAGKTYQLARYWGPERLETGWWHGPLHRRDYYRLETTDGRWLWIYHDLRSHGWFLHGYFA